MENRNVELLTKVKTPAGERLEEEYRENIGDIRILLAKEYCTMLVGAGDQKAYHHMGPLKKRRSLLAKDAQTFEAYIRVSVQVVYLALGRRHYQEIETETHRLLKSATFNAIKHKAMRAHSGTPAKQTRTTEILMGTCLRRDRHLLTHSPLMNELFCTRPIDYRLKGIGVVKYPE
ncbi:uncharacterized protein LOC113508357 isoform X2 [Trichoplusia ni]|uniref:Uncharacterized protein LOC113508357 isoform X2 n=1 Tax=Trichoplusia ni TaxID=7111 RepID=A0A7E5X3Y3_TRINI|nr:uncharacterized protein LOC113508357 isoform X2 [Trichoplusia ni]